MTKLCCINMDDLFLKAKSKRRPIDDDTISESGLVDGNEVFLINLSFSTSGKKTDENHYILFKSSSS